MNFILNLTRRIKNSLKRLMNIESDPFIVEETTIRRLDIGLFKGNKHCTSCDNIKPCLRVCKQCKSYVCAPCFVRYIVEEISFKSLCRNNHSILISPLVLNNEDDDDNTDSSIVANF